MNPSSRLKYANAVYAFKQVRVRARQLSVRIPPYDQALTASEFVARLARWLLRNEDQEVVLAFLLDASKHVIAVQEVSRGTVDQCIVHPREVFRGAVLYGAAAIVLAHNHPSGSAVPSVADARVTRALAEAGGALGIALLDHVIVTSREEHYSFARDGALHDSSEACCSEAAEDWNRCSCLPEPVDGEQVSA